MAAPRIALYGHDSLGLGHLRRNLALAGSLAALPARPDLLIATGAVEAGAFPLPPRTDLLQVPAVGKGRDGRYRSGRLSMDLDSVVSIRRAVLTAGLEAFAPDLVVVDKVALGLGDELRPVLHRLRAARGTRLVLGLRDVLDSPSTTRAEWAAAGTDAVLRALYDEIWVYGDPAVHDVVVECGLDHLRPMVRHTGYLAAGRVGAPVRPPVVPEGTPYVLCTVGGGADGGDLADAFARTRLPDGTFGVLLTGSQMPAPVRRRLEHLAARRSDLAVVALTPELPRWIPGARAVVGMGGYNSVSEILATTTPALVVPRRVPRQEQLIRARALAARGYVDSVEARYASPRSLGAWLAGAVRRRATERRGIDLAGLDRVRALASRLLPGEAGPTVGPRTREVGRAVAV